MWFSRFLTISARVCVCHVNLRQFILDSHFAHINMHVNVNAIALVCIIRFFSMALLLLEPPNWSSFAIFCFCDIQFFVRPETLIVFHFLLFAAAAVAAATSPSYSNKSNLKPKNPAVLQEFFCFWIRFLCYLTRATVVCISIVAVFLSLSFNLEICIQMREHGTVSSCLLQSQSSILRFDCLLFCISNWFNKS